MPFTARFNGTCRKCSRPILAGQVISWARKGIERGKVFHVDCSNPDSTVDTRPELPETAARPLTDGERELAALKLKLAELEKSGTEQPEPATSSKPAKKPKSSLKPSSTWYEVFGAVLPYSDRILLIGPPSSGKSTTAMLTAKTQHRITMTETTAREDLIGMFHLIDGNTKWIDGPITSAMRLGHPVLIDEIDRYSPECASLLYSLIDDKPHVSLPTGEQVNATVGYKVIMTSNEGLGTLPVAVQDRIEVVIMAREPHEAALAGLPKAQQQVVARYYKSLPVQPVKLQPSVRRMRAFHTLVESDIPANIAANLVFGEQGGKEILSVITSAEGTGLDVSENVKKHVRNQCFNSAVAQHIKDTGATIEGATIEQARLVIEQLAGRKIGW